MIAAIRRARSEGNPIQAALRLSYPDHGDDVDLALVFLDEPHDQPEATGAELA